MKLLSVAVVTLAAASAFAAKSNTEYYYQPAGGQQEVQLTYGMDSKPAKLDTAGTDLKTETSDINVAYWYGLSEGNAIGVHTFYGSLKDTASDHTATGMGDIFLGYKGFSDMWHYGFDLGIATSKIKIDSTSGGVDNRSSGGMSLKPNVGILVGAGALNYGADLSYDYLMERSVDNTANTKLTDGNILKLAPFIEWNYGMGFLGGELSYNMVGDTTVKSDGAADSKTKGEGYINAKVFASYDFSDMVTGLADVGMGMHPSHDQTDAAGTDTVKAYTETAVNIGVRLNF